MVAILKKLVIAYEPENGIPYSDALTEQRFREIVERLIEGPYDHAKTFPSTENFIYVARIAIRENWYPDVEYEFQFNHQVIPHNQNGKLEHWPKGFCDKTDDYLQRLLSKEWKLC